MGTTIDIPTTDGHKLTGYRAEPQGEPRGGIVVIQEIFGVNSHIRSVADGYAAEGYVALAPAMFDRVERDIQLGYTADDVTEGREIRAKIDYDDAVRDVGAAVAVLSGMPVGVVGYCWGGSLAWSAATRLDGLQASVGYYGGFVPEMSDETPRHPVMLHFGETDESIPLEGVEKVKAAHPDVPIYLYPAGHGFNCDQRGSYDEASATLALERTLAFFAEHVSKA